MNEKDKEIIEATEIGYEMGRGPSIIKTSFGLKILEYYIEYGKLY